MNLYKEELQNIKKVNKFDKIWQIVRMRLKKLNWKERERLLMVYFNNNYQNYLRILNYLQSVYISTKERQPATIANKLSKLPMDNTKNINIEYTEKELQSVYNNVLKRHNTWLDGGYFNKQQDDFLQTVANELKINYEPHKLNPTKSHKFLF